MTTNYSCRLCDSKNLDRVMNLTRSPESISRLFQYEEDGSDACCDIEVFMCQDCSFVQHFNFVSQTFYNEYIMTVTHSPQMCLYQEQQAAYFVDRFSLKNKKLIELGCGDGNFMGYLASQGSNVFGIEPSSAFRKEAKKAGHRVFEGYITEKSPAPEGPYDAFVTRQVLEHVPNIIDFLRGARASITKDGVGLVEVPSLEQALRYGRFFDFFRDHVNYFTFKTLLQALTTAGFETIEMNRGMNGEFLIAYVMVSKLKPLNELEVARDELTLQIHQFVEECRNLGQRVAIWGAGGKGLSCMAAVGGEHISYIIDSDPHKVGLYAPVTQLPIVSQSRLQEDPVDAIILTSLAYKSEIISNLRGPLQFKGKIAVIGSPLEIMEL